MATAALTACGGSSTLHGGPTPVAPPTPTPAPVSTTATLTLPAPGQSLSLPAFGGYSASYVVPSGAGAGTTTTVTVSTVAPADAIAPESIRTGSLKTSALASRTMAAGGATAAALFYVQEDFSTTFTWSTFPTWTVTVPATVAATGLTLEIFDGSSQALIAAANGTASGQTITFAFSTPGGESIVAGHPYLVELVSGSGLNLSFRPNGSGDAFAYSGTLTEQFVRPPVSTPPTPDPNSSPSSQTLTAAVTANVVVANGASFNNLSNLSDFTSTESDVYSSPPRTVTSTSNQYLNYVPSGASTQLFVVGSAVTDSLGTSTTTTYGSGNGLLDVLPEVAGPIAPANTAALSTTETDADAQTTTQTFNANGSYAETTNYPGGFTGTATENSDGSGTYSVPLEEFPNTTIAYGAVTGGNIPVTITFPPGLAGPGTVMQTLLVEDWYPATPPVLYAQTYVNNGAVAPPVACAVPGALAKPTNQLVQTTTTVDTVFGETETQTITSYVAQGLGAVCLQLNDTTLQYYDFTGQTQYTLYFNSTPVQTTTINETLALQTATVTDTTAAARASLSAPVARALTGRFEAIVAHERALRHAADLKKSSTLIRVQAPLMGVSH